MKLASICWMLPITFLTACVVPSQATTLPQMTATQQPVASAFPTATFTPKPTQTPTPTASPPATYTPWPTKQVLVEFGIFGGDGGWITSSFAGRDTPELVLYADGQLIIKSRDIGPPWFEETKLSAPQMCSFLAQIENVGFYTLETDSYANENDNPIYQLDESAHLGEGGPHYIIQVNGPKPKRISIYYGYVQYLIPKARRIFDLFAEYTPPSKRSLYQPPHLLMRIQNESSYPIQSTPIPWPTNLPDLDTLAKENVETMASDYFRAMGTSGYQISQTVIEGAQVVPVLETFNNRMIYKLFQSDKKVPYLVVARPLLPHETLNHFSSFPEEKTFELPFNCNP